MNPALIAQAVLQYGPAIIDLLAKLDGLRRAGKAEVTEADWAELRALSTKTAADFLAEARDRKRDA